MRVLIVDDHPIIVAGCAAMLANEGDIEVFDARDAEAGFAAFVTHGPDAAVIDIALPGASGFELTRRILRFDPQARIVVFSMNDDPIFAARAIEAGAKGYVTKNDDPYLLLRALREVMAGGVFLMPRIANRLATSDNGAANPLDSLSARELEILHGTTVRTTYDTRMRTASAVRPCANSQNGVRQNAPQFHLPMNRAPGFAFAGASARSRATISGASAKVVTASSQR